MNLSDLPSCSQLGLDIPALTGGGASNALLDILSLCTTNKTNPLSPTTPLQMQYTTSSTTSTRLLPGELSVPNTAQQQQRKQEQQVQKHQIPTSSASAAVQQGDSALLTTLKRVLRLLNDEFVREFLLYPDASADLAMLTSPLPLSYAMCGSLEEASYSMDGNTQGLLDQDFVLDYVTLPAFSVGNIGVGAILEELTSTSNSLFTDLPNTKAFSRFVTDAKTAEMLNVCYRERSSVVDVFYIKPECYTGCTNVTFRFEKNAFVHACGNAAGEGIDYGALLKALQFYKSSQLERFCPLCNVSPKVKCTCELKFIQPAFPLDFSHYAHNMATYVGRYVGEGVHKAVLNEGSTLLSGKMLSRCSVNVANDNNTKQKLLQWALHQKYDSLNTAPYMLPTASVNNPCNSLVTPENVPYSDLSSQENAQNGPDASHQGSATSAMNFDQEFHPVGPNRVPASNALSRMCTSTTAPIASPNFKMTANNSCASQPRNTPSAAVLAAATQPIIGLSNTPNPTPIAPREAFLQPSPNSSELTEHKSLEEKAKEERRLRRIQKNRESAARSNLRRRQMRDKLKQDLIDAKAKAEMLRKRETVLREDNMRLRALLPRVLPSST